MASPNAVFVGVNAQLKGTELEARSEGMESLDVKIAPVARDTANVGAEKYLRRGLVLTRLASGVTLGGMNYEGYYVHYLPTGTPGLLGGQDDVSNAVILKHDHDLTAVADQAIADGATYSEIYCGHASGFTTGTFWRDAVIAPSGFFAAAVLDRRQRLQLLRRR